MPITHLRRSDVQAHYAFVLSLLSVVPCVVAAGLAYRNYNPDLTHIVYGSGGRFLPVFAGCVLISMAPSFLGFILGWTSAGQRRNDKQKRSWIGFFVGGVVFTLNVILLVAFYMLRLQTGE